MNLAIQLLMATVLMTIATVIHGTGVALSTKLFRYEDRKIRQQRLAAREVTLMVPMALTLFALHATEIAVYAAFYLLVGEAASFAQALHMSGLAYTTMGVLEGTGSRWPLVVTFEGLTGFLLIGWSAAVFVTDMDRVLRRRDPD
ncbi:MAG TPA: hypothetical protein VM265_03975 [Sphingomicrobium sp.]|nr:hypothetical protein [Sphingomicrobium sp.]